MQRKRQGIPGISYRMEFGRNGCFSRVWPTNCPIIGLVLVLALDTSSPSGSIAVLRDEKVIGVVSTTGDETYSSRMFRQLEFLLAELKLSHGDFDLFAVNSGPGSFTGLARGTHSGEGLGGGLCQASGADQRAGSCCCAIAARIRGGSSTRCAKGAGVLRLLQAPRWPPCAGRR